MSFEEALCKLGQLISRQNDYFCNALQNYQAISNHDCAEERLELFPVANHRIFIAGLRNFKICLRAAIAN